MTGSLWSIWQDTEELFNMSHKSPGGVPKLRSKFDRVKSRARTSSSGASASAAQRSWRSAFRRGLVPFQCAQRVPWYLPRMAFGGQKGSKYILRRYLDPLGQAPFLRPLPLIFQGCVQRHAQREQPVAKFQR